jgi:diaminopimelate epimerase
MDDMTRTSIRFTKMSGSGNDFIVIDNRGDPLAGLDLAALTRSVSRHRLSVGADGVVLLSEPPADRPDLAYGWRYINADGTDGEMCGNGAMCAARFAVRAGIAGPHHSFLTESGVVEAWADADSPAASIALADPGRVQKAVSVGVAGRSFVCSPIVVGVPHIVIRVPDADAFADADAFHRIGRALRLHYACGPAGTNVNVVSSIDGQTWRMRTYERGVEAETLACGTGAVATAIVLANAGDCAPPVTIRTSGGRDLRVEFVLRDGQARGVRLSGQAAVIYDGELGEDALLDQDSSQKTRRNSAES